MWRVRLYCRRPDSPSVSQSPHPRKAMKIQRQFEGTFARAPSFGANIPQPGHLFWHGLLRSYNNLIKNGTVRGVVFKCECDSSFEERAKFFCSYDGVPNPRDCFLLEDQLIICTN